ncbi:hypothetical protein ACIBI9_58040 [Nonomuraea sp. NPDC050451]|uniref:hypothetical protein n=1 Tax=Nonomuraea sp. NPDC050451 TaxID=3364364 RepID=UPI00378EC57D
MEEGLHQAVSTFTGQVLLVSELAEIVVVGGLPGEAGTRVVTALTGQLGKL